jgi:hypothetical protein
MLPTFLQRYSSQQLQRTIDLYPQRNQREHGVVVPRTKKQIKKRRLTKLSSTIRRDRRFTLIQGRLEGLKFLVTLQFPTLGSGKTDFTIGLRTQQFHELLRC